MYDTGIRTHVSDVSKKRALSYEKLIQMATATGDALLLRQLQDDISYLLDETRYVDVPLLSADQIPRVSIPWWRIKELIDAGVLSEISPDEVRGGMRVFGVHEHKNAPKERIRIIKWTIYANEVLGKETLHEVNFPSKSRICNLVLDGEYAACYDFKSWYD